MKIGIGMLELFALRWINVFSLHYLSLTNKETVGVKANMIEKGDDGRTVQLWKLNRDQETYYSFVLFFLI